MTTRIPDNIPKELQPFDQWVCWRWEEREGKRTKPPVNARTGGYASSTNRATWSAFTKAVATFEAGKADGIGFVFCEHCPFAGVDLDDCRDPQTGVIEPRAQEIIRALNSYTEVSPSETGVKIFLRGSLPPGAPEGGNKDQDRKSVV